VLLTQHKTPPGNLNEEYHKQGRSGSNRKKIERGQGSSAAEQTAFFAGQIQGVSGNAAQDKNAALGFKGSER